MAGIKNKAGIHQIQEIRQSQFPLYQKHVYLHTPALERYEDSHKIPPSKKKEIARYIVDKLVLTEEDGCLSLLDAGIGHGNDVLFPILEDVLENKEKIKKIEVYGFDNSEQQLRKLEKNVDSFAKNLGISNEVNTESLSDQIIYKITTNGKKIVLKVFKFDIEKEIDFFVKRRNKFHIVIAEFLLHHLLNWRMGIIKLLFTLKKNGGLVFSERMGDIKYLDGNFEGLGEKKYKADKENFYNFLKKFHDLKNDIFYWNPEIRASDYSSAVNYLQPHFKSTTEVPFEYNYQNFSTRKLIQEWIKDKVYTHFWIGIKDYDSFNGLFKIAEDSSDNFDLNDGQNIIILKGFKGITRDNVDYWMTRTILKKCSLPCEPDIQKIGNQFLDLIISHDILFPETTQFIGVHPWDLIKDDWGEPIQLVVNLETCDPDADKNKHKIEIIKNYVGYLKYATQIGFSINAFIFRTLAQKIKISLSLCEEKDPRVDVSYDKLMNIEEVTICVPLKVKNSVKMDYTNERELEKEIEKEVQEKAKYIKADVFKVDLSKDFREKCAGFIEIKNLKGKDYENMKNILIQGFEKTKLTELWGERSQKSEQKTESEDNRSRKNNLENLSKSILGLATFFLRDKEKLIYIPSGIIKEKSYGDEIQKILGFGGIALLEKHDYSNNNSLNPFFKTLSIKRTEILRYITNLVFTRIGIINWSKKNQHNLIKYSTRSAVAAIMSRNGSHNIGSHILSAVGQDINDVIDDQLLFYYIQHRMDYVAQITTELPKWSYPVPFVHDLMRRFYIQKHLLNHIASSEGLKAYEFKERETNDIKDKLVINIRSKEEKATQYIISPQSIYEKETVMQPTLVAIPGGIVGQQAFYTILENIIRNSAKHSWANLSEQEKKQCKNLVITIEYEDDPSKAYVKFKIWDNISENFPLDNFSDKEIIANDLLPVPIVESNDNVLYQVEQENFKFKNLPLHMRQNIFLTRSFVDSQDGRLRNENWGLAEMKISVGYLNMEDVDSIGKEGKGVLFKEVKNNEYQGLIRACGVKVLEDNGEQFHLGYEFAIPKPKEVLIIGYKSEKLDELKARKKSVYFKKDRPDKLDYEFVIICDEKILNEEDILINEIYPFRLFLLSDDDNDFDFNGRVMKLNKEYFETLIKNANSEQRIKGLDSWDFFKIDIYKHWIKKFSPNKNFPLSIYVSLDASENSGLRLSEEYEEWKEILKDQELEKKKHILKTEEEIETLPFIFRSKGMNGEDRNLNNGDRFSLNKIKDVVRQERDHTDIVYERHCIPSPAHKKIYMESLSGSQVYINILEMLKENSYFSLKLQLQLVENALLKILIIDERLADYFYKKGSELRDRFLAARLYPLYEFIYENKAKPIISYDKKNCKHWRGKVPCIDFSKLKKDEYLVLIIHQTILDEFFENDVKQMEKFIKNIKDKIRLVVVTSGRGNPDKLPKNAKFLPFSNLDSFLMKDNHEKYLLFQILFLSTRKKDEDLG